MKKSLKIIVGLISFLAFSDIALAYSGDIAIDKNLSFSSDKIIEDQTIRIYSTSINNSSKDLLGVVKFYDNGKEIGSDQPVSLFAGKNDGVFVDWTPTKGSHNIVVKLYPWNPEIDNPSNNEFSKTVFVIQDSDHDGISNPEEVQMGTDPLKADTDNDGINDPKELIAGTDPRKSDSDGDGLSDGDELNKYHLNPLKGDSDIDDLSDGEEVNKYHTDPLKSDTDGDHFSDANEINIYHTDPLKFDSDEDGIPDTQEVNLFHTDPIKNDSDSDGLSDGQEVRQGTMALNPDSDEDGILDKADIAPLNKAPIIKLSEINTNNFTDSVIVDLLSDKKFDASPSYDVDGKIVTYSWEIDDKKIAEGKKVLNQTFKTLGKHKIKLTISDDSKQSVSKEFEVSVVKATLYKELLVILALILLALAIHFKYIRPAKDPKNQENP